MAIVSTPTSSSAPREAPVAISPTPVCTSAPSLAALEISNLDTGHLRHWFQF